MSFNNTPLPHKLGKACLTDAGLETWLVFHQGVKLRHFASFELLSNDSGRSLLENYFRAFMDTAQEGAFGFVAETATWRANPKWGVELGYSLDELARINRDSVNFLHALRCEYANAAEIFVSGNLGPYGDGYVPGEQMTVAEAQEFHAWQIDVLAHARTDLISAFTITNTPEAKGIARACHEADIPCVISFTLETDGHLPTGQALPDAIREMDASPHMRPVYFMINCAHPDHFREILRAGGSWSDRIAGIRANASRCSHAELDEAEELDDGDPVELAEDYREIGRLLPKLRILGGCCGTDHRHVAAIARAMP